MEVCPRCGLRHRGIHVKSIGGRAYAYAYHGRGPDKRPLYCYLGPADGYVAVSKVKGAQIENLELESIHDLIQLLEAYIFRKRRILDNLDIRERATAWGALVEDLARLKEVVERELKRAEQQREIWSREAAREADLGEVLGGARE